MNLLHFRTCLPAPLRKPISKLIIRIFCKWVGDPFVLIIKAK